MRAPRWTEVAPSEFPWEREAHDFLRERLPDRDPYRAWSNFEFITDTGSVNEVDVLVLTPRGLFLVEIKSYPDRITGDAGTWTRHRSDRHERIDDNPVILANQKAKRLKSLLESRAAERSRQRIPFIAPLVFLSHPEVEPRMDPSGRMHVCVRDPDEEGGSRPGGLPGIVAEACTVTPEDKARRRFRPVTTDQAREVARAIDAAGIRESRRRRRAGDYDLGELIEDGPGYQEFAATHVALPDAQRRIRVFIPDAAADRETVQEAARRQFTRLDRIDHPGILRPRDYLDLDRGPALIFDREPEALTLDRYLETRGRSLDLGQRIEIIRQLAETLAYTHEQGLVHRALAPRSVLVCDPDSEAPRLRIRDWHLIGDSRTRTGSETIATTAHLEDLAEATVVSYLAPEAGLGRGGEHLDVFGLGAISFHVFTGRAPASSRIERDEHLREHGGLDLAAVIDGVGDYQRLLVLGATAPDVDGRTPSVTQFARDLDDVEEELTAPDLADEEVTDPTRASAGDELCGYRVRTRLGRGGTAVAYLVDDGDDLRVLKVAASPDRNDRIREEGDVLDRVRDPGIVRIHRRDLMVRGHAAIVIDQAGEQTLAAKLRADGPAGLELLERWGDDLLGAVASLEEQGIAHRDIKPQNIGIRRRGKDKRLRMVLFDFSLSRAPDERIEAGTPPYLDPFLRLPKRGRWDLHAERFAAAMTLHEIATGQLPRWGVGKSDPVFSDDEVTIDPALFDAAVAEPLTAFFRKALRREAPERFDTAEEMRRDWTRCFVEAATPTTDTGEPVPTELALQATHATPLGDLGLSARAASALRRLEEDTGEPVRTVADLLAVPEFRLRSLPGVGSGTREELVAVLGGLREHLAEADEPPEVRGLGLLADQLVPKRSWDTTDLDILRHFLGLPDDEAASPALWHTTTEIARSLGADREHAETVIERGRERWEKSVPSVTVLRAEIADLVTREAGVISVPALEEALLSLRGAAEDDPARRQALAAAALRAAAAVEEAREEPRFLVGRLEGALVAVAPQIVEVDSALAYAKRLGERASALVATGVIPSARALEALRAVDPPSGLPLLSDARILRLASVVGQGVAANRQRELYPVGMPAEEALRHAVGAIRSPRLTPEDARRRVAARYPRAEPLPDRPSLDDLLAEYGLRFDDGEAAYVPTRGPLDATRLSAGVTTASRGEQDTERFDQRLERARNRFLALTARQSRARSAEHALSQVEGISVVALDALLLDEMRALAGSYTIDWSTVLTADAEPEGSANRQNLHRLAREAADGVRERLLATPGTVLATRPGLLARYQLLDVLAEVRRQLASPMDDHPLKGLWLLVPTTGMGGGPMIDGNPVPVLDENEWARVPSAWIQTTQEAPSQS